MKKTILFIVALCFVATTYAQQKKDLKYNENTNLIEATYYHDNGQVSQEGTFDVAGKLHGKWISYNEAGEKTSSGSYKKGVRTGKWLFWEKDVMKEVKFNDNAIASVVDKQNQSKLVIKD